MRFAASPLARRLAKEHRLDLAGIQGSGPDGRIVRRDIEAAIKTPKITQQTGAPSASYDPRLFYDKDSYDEIKLTPMQRAIAKRLTQSMQLIPHYYVSMTYDASALIEMRGAAKRLCEARKSQLIPTINDFLVRAAALALMDVPLVNVSFADDRLLRHHHADIGVAIALDHGGLITPIVRRAEQKSILQIAQDIRQLAELARAKKLKPNQYEGGSFSVSNLGMFGVAHFTAIINPPQAAILAIGGIDEEEKITTTLSCDHRAINGAIAAQFLAVLGEIIEAPHWLWLR